MKKLAAIFLLTVLLAGAMIPINQVSAQPNKKAPKQISLYDIGILQLVAHDFYHVDRDTEIDAEDEKLNLSTVLDQGDENIANGGEPRNMENILVFTVATQFGQMYLDLIDKGQSQDQARKIVLGKYISDVKKAYQNTFDEKFPKPAAEEEDDDNLTGDLALRTVHDLLPGKIKVNGVLTPILDPSLIGKTLGKHDLKQLSSPLDGQFDPEFSSVLVPDPDNPGSFTIIDLLERDSSFAEQFETDYSFEFFLDEIKDGHYDKNDIVMQIIRDEISAGLVSDSEDNPQKHLPLHHNPDKIFKFKKISPKK